MRVSQQTRMPLDVSGVMFEAVRGWVSHQALRKVQEQHRLLLMPLRAHCSHSFTSSYGLPCVHTLKRLEENNQMLSLGHFHAHWHLKRDAVQPRPILEPHRVLNRAIQISNPSATSTRREPCGFEMVEPKKAPPTCSRCHQVGHQMRANICPLKYSDLLPTSSARNTPTRQASPSAQLQAEFLAAEEI
jgi:hypothetical protein